MRLEPGRNHQQFVYFVLRNAARRRDWRVGNHPAHGIAKRLLVRARLRRWQLGPHDTATDQVHTIITTDTLDVVREGERLGGKPHAVELTAKVLQTLSLVAEDASPLEFEPLARVLHGRR